MTNHKSEPSLSPELYTEEYFLTACEGYQEWIDSEGQQLSRRLASAFELASVEEGMMILDLGCGRGEIVRHCANMGAHAIGIDYAPVAVRLTRDLIEEVGDLPGKMGVAQSDAKHLPFPSEYFDRVLIFDVVEHLYPWELHQMLLEVQRILKPDGKVIVHTAPNRWYDKYAYPVVRVVRTIMGQGAQYPKNPRQFGVAVNEHVHVNEQDLFSMKRILAKAGFNGKVWLDSPPQNRQESALMSAMRHVAFNWVPFAWFFEREVFAVAQKQS